MYIFRRRLTLAVKFLFRFYCDGNALIRAASAVSKRAQSVYSFQKSAPGESGIISTVVVELKLYARCIVYFSELYDSAAKHHAPLESDCSLVLRLYSHSQVLPYSTHST